MENQFENEFLDFYSANLELYGETEEGIDEAYSDFLTQAQDAELEAEVSEFEDFFSEMEDVYGNTEEGIEEAYNDFIALKEAEGSEDVEEMEDEFSEVELGFMDFYNQMSEVYGETEEGIEEAYNDYIEAIEDVEDIYSDEDEYSAKSTAVGAAVGAGLAYLGGKYTERSDKKRGPKLEAKIKELEKKVKDLRSKGKGTLITESRINELKTELRQINTRKNNSKQTRRGQLAAGAIAGAVGGGWAGNELSRGTNHSDYNEGDDYQFSEEDEALFNEFAQFYADTEDIYGDDVEAAFDDYADALEVLANEEDVYSDEYMEEDEYGMLDKAKGFAGKATYKAKGLAGKAGNFAGTTAGRATTGAAAGALIGGVAGALTDKNKAERKALKAKMKSGSASEADKAKLAQLRKERRNRILKASGAGAVGGAAVGVASKGVAAGVGQVKSNLKARKEKLDGYKNSTMSDESKKKASNIVKKNNKSFEGVRAAVAGAYKKPVNTTASDMTKSDATDKNFSLLGNDTDTNKAGTYVSKLIKG